MVSRAVFTADTGVLDFKLRPGDNSPQATHTVTVSNINYQQMTETANQQNAHEVTDDVNLHVYLNGVLFSDYQIDVASSSLSINAPGWDSDQSPNTLHFVVQFNA